MEKTKSAAIRALLPRKINVSASKRLVSSAAVLGSGLFPAMEPLRHDYQKCYRIGQQEFFSADRLTSVSEERSIITQEMSFGSILKKQH